MGDMTNKNIVLGTCFVNVSVRMAILDVPIRAAGLADQAVRVNRFRAPELNPFFVNRVLSETPVCS